jgi:hypothetical protein
MRFISDLIKHIEAAAAARERAAQEAFLADATDIYDVEARMREWDRLHGAGAANYPGQSGLNLH